MATDLSKYNNSWYKPGPAVKRIAWHFVSAFFFRSGLFPFYGLKVFLSFIRSKDRTGCFDQAWRSYQISLVFAGGKSYLDRRTGMDR